MGKMSRKEVLDIPSAVQMNFHGFRCALYQINFLSSSVNIGVQLKTSSNLDNCSDEGRSFIGRFSCCKISKGV